MKKGVVIFSSVLAIILLSSFALAAVPMNVPAPPQLPGPNAAAGAFEPIVDILNQGMNGFALLFNGLFNAHGLADASLAKFLLFMLVTLVLLKPAEKITHRTDIVAWAVALIVSLLGVFWIPVDIVNTILLPYNTLGIVAATYIPLAMLAYFISTLGEENSVIRKSAWIASGLVFLGIWMFRLGDAGINQTFHWIYLSAAAVCLVALFGDGMLHRFTMMFQSEKVKGQAVKQDSAALMGKRAQLEQWMTALPKGANEQKEAIMGEILEIDNDLKRLRKV